MSKEHNAPALARREPSIYDVDREAFAKAAQRALRDEFARAALTGLLANSAISSLSYQEIAEETYEWADAMLKARGQ